MTKKKHAAIYQLGVRVKQLRVGEGRRGGLSPISELFRSPGFIEQSFEETEVKHKSSLFFVSGV